MPPTNSRKRSSPRGARRKRGTLLVAAVSGRALARAAVDAGFDALIADFFADADTARLSHACRKQPGEIARGFQWRSLGPALEALAKQAPSPLLGLVYGSGFEDRPHLLSRLAESWPLLGNDAETVARIKNPETFFATLDKLAIPHPATAMTRPRNGAGWVAKRRGGAGGGHVVPSRLQRDAKSVYYQALAQGRAVSALFVANGSRARVLGFSEQWTAPTPRSPWRYGGAVQPTHLPDDAADAMARAVTLLAAAFGLKGLGSADFVLVENRPLLIEINPRLGATLDIFACAKKPLLRLHIDAVLHGALPRRALAFEGAAASAIVHAPKAVVVPRSMIWPSWAADLSRPGERIDKQRPICTVLARAGTEARAKRLAETRKATLLAKIQEMSKGDECERQETRRKRNASDEAAEHQRAGRAAGRRDHR